MACDAVGKAWLFGLGSADLNGESWIRDKPVRRMSLDIGWLILWLSDGAEKRLLRGVSR